MFNPNSWACYIIYKVTCLPWPFIINKCQLVVDTPPRTNRLKKDKNSLNKKKSSMPSLHNHACTWFA